MPMLVLTPMPAALSCEAASYPSVPDRPMIPTSPSF